MALVIEYGDHDPRYVIAVTSRQPWVSELATQTTSKSYWQEAKPRTLDFITCSFSFFDHHKPLLVDRSLIDRSSDAMNYKAAKVSIDSLKTPAGLTRETDRQMRMPPKYLA